MTKNNFSVSQRLEIARASIQALKEENAGLLAYIRKLESMTAIRGGAAIKRPYTDLGGLLDAIESGQYPAERGE